MQEINEAELLSAFRSGVPIDGATAGTKRAVQAALLRTCCDAWKEEAGARGLWLSNVIIVGCLDLAGLAVRFPLRFDGCEFDTAPVLEGAQLFELSLDRCPRLPGLLGNGLQVRRDLVLSGCHVAGAHATTASTSRRSAVWLCESEIGGRLLCVGTTIDGQGERSIQADRARVGGGVQLIHGFTSLGEIRLVGSSIGGPLNLTGVKIESLNGPAIDLADTTISGSVFIVSDPDGRRSFIRGRIDMSNARVSGRILVRDAAVDARADGAGSADATSGPGVMALSASRLSVGAEVAFEGHCEISGCIDVSMGDMGSVTIGSNCVLRAPDRTALDLTHAQIRTLFRLDENASAEGTIRLASAVIHGTLALHGTVGRPEALSLVGGSMITVDGDVYLNGLRTHGGVVNFRSATLGSLSADGAQLDNPDGRTISLEQTTVKGSVRLVNGFTSTGLVALNGYTIGGSLRLTDGRFDCPSPGAANEDGHAIAAISATVREGLDLGWSSVVPSVDFTDVSTTYLADDPELWPTRFTISGMTYDRFQRPQGARPFRVWDWTRRCAWLSRQTVFDAGAYEQVASVYRQHGYPREAEQILMAGERHARQIGQSSTTLLQRIASAICGIVFGYGYRPLRIMFLLVALLGLVIASLEIPADQATLRTTSNTGLVYSTTHLLTTTNPTALPSGSGQSNSPSSYSCADGEVRCFDPALYAIDTVIPLISLDQRSTWYPDTRVPRGELMLWWLNIATILGWLISSYLVLSLARLYRRP